MEPALQGHMLSASLFCWGLGTCRICITSIIFANKGLNETTEVVRDIKSHHTNTETHPLTGPALQALQTILTLALQHLDGSVYKHVHYCGVKCLVVVMFKSFDPPLLISGLAYRNPFSIP